MRGYWLKIMLGAGVIALVGTIIVRLAKAGMENGPQVVETADPIVIPLAFLPFNLDGHRVGALKQLRINRSAPESVESFRIRVEVADLATFESLSTGCVLSVENPSHLSTSTSFSCGAPDSSMLEFGTVEIALAEGSTNRLVVTLYLPARVVAEFRGTPADSGQAAVPSVYADSLAQSMRQMAETISRQTRELADSLRRQAASRVPPQ
ncbi:MAG: hypothetical protein SGI84_05450 [Gemmatimonadota bacterium]|nr:hypothetical protein [Gemmatimonadota bacterium]